MVGDLNIAPLEHDVWSHKQLLKIVSHTPIEVEKLTAIKTAGNWVDAVRHFAPENEKLYSWWSYRAPRLGETTGAAGSTISGSRPPCRRTSKLPLPPRHAQLETAVGPRRGDPGFRLERH